MSAQLETQGAMMAYQMTEITPQVRIGRTCKGEFNIEIWTPSFCATDPEFYQIFVPAEAAADLAKYLMLQSAPKIDDILSCPICRWPAMLEESSGHGDPPKSEYSFWRVRCAAACHPSMETDWKRNAVAVMREWNASGSAESV